MSYDITNEQGGHWKISNSGWYEILETASNHGWDPIGTLMYKHSGIHPDMITINAADFAIASSGGVEDLPIIIQDGKGDKALGFYQATKSNEVDPKWVSNAIEFSRRRENLSWGHHKIVASLNHDEQDKFLFLAEQGDNPLTP